MIVLSIHKPGEKDIPLYTSQVAISTHGPSEIVFIIVATVSAPQRKITAVSFLLVRHETASNINVLNSLLKGFIVYTACVNTHTYTPGQWRALGQRLRNHSFTTWSSYRGVLCLTVVTSTCEI